MLFIAASVNAADFNAVLLYAVSFQIRKDDSVSLLNFIHRGNGQRFSGKNTAFCSAVYAYVCIFVDFSKFLLHFDNARQLTGFAFLPFYNFG